MAEMNLTRRGALAIAGVSTLAALTGCTQTEEIVEEPAPIEETFDFNTHYLPPGSVVKLIGTIPEHIRVMVVSRRPKILGEGGGDYLGVWYPFGITVDFNDKMNLTSQLIPFDIEQIEKIDHVGYVNDFEVKAAVILDAAMGTDKASEELLFELSKEYFFDGMDPDEAMQMVLEEDAKVTPQENTVEESAENTNE